MLSEDHFLANGPIASSCTRRLVQRNLSLITKNLLEKRRRRKILKNYHLKKSVLALKGGFDHCHTLSLLKGATIDKWYHQTPRKVKMSKNNLQIKMVDLY
jgi:hypothetical protein